MCSCKYRQFISFLYSIKGNAVRVSVKLVNEKKTYRKDVLFSFDLEEEIECNVSIADE